MTSGYGELQYWNTRYTEQGSDSVVYDWYMPFDQVQAQILPYVHNYLAAKGKNGPPSGASTISSTSQPQTTPPDGVKAESATEQEHKTSNDVNATKTEPTDTTSTVTPPTTPTDYASLNVLVIGCGNSELSIQLYQLGFRNILSVDFSPPVIDQMKQRYSETIEQSEHKFDFQCMDVRDMKALKTSAYDLIIDKGTLDSILCGTDSNKHSTQMLTECRRLLTASGILLVITYGAPSNRLSYLQKSRYNWTVNNVNLGKNRFLYTCVRKD